MTLKTDVDQLAADAQLMHDIVHGGPSDEVSTEGGSIPTAAKAIDTLKLTDPKGNWVTSTDYVARDVVVDPSNDFGNGADLAYMCLVTHTSGTAATDWASGKWVLFKGILASELISTDATEGDALITVKPDAPGGSAISLHKWMEKDGLKLQRGFDCKADGIKIADVSITATNNRVTTTSTIFSAADVGKRMVIIGAGTAGERLVSSITGYVGANQVDLADNASTTVSNANAYYGTDDTAKILNAVSELSSGSKLGNERIIFEPTLLTSQFYWVEDSILIEDVIQVELLAFQGAHIRNEATDKAIIKLRGSGSFGPTFGHTLLGLFLTGGAPGTSAALELENCILSWFERLYIDTSPGHGVLINGSSSENNFNRIIVETPGKAGVRNDGALNDLTNIHVTGAGESGIIDGSGAYGNTYTAVKALLSQFHGLDINGSSALLMGCRGRNNSQTGVGIYSGMSLAGTDNIAACFIGDDNQGTATQKYGARVAGTNNQLTAVSGSGNVSKLVEDAGTNSSIFMGGDAQVNGFTHKTPIIHKNLDYLVDGDASPSVSGGNKFRTNNTGATSITTFDDGTNGQSVRIVALDNNTTFVHSSAFNLGGSNIVTVAGDIIDFELIGSTWYGRKL